MPDNNGTYSAVIDWLDRWYVQPVDRALLAAGESLYGSIPMEDISPHTSANFGRMLGAAPRTVVKGLTGTVKAVPGAVGAALSDFLKNLSAGAQACLAILLALALGAAGLTAFAIVKF